MRIEISQVKFVVTKISMSQQTTQEATRTREEKFVAIKKILSRQKMLRNQRNLVATEKTLLR